MTLTGGGGVAQGRGCMLLGEGGGCSAPFSSTLGVLPGVAPTPVVVQPVYSPFPSVPYSLCPRSFALPVDVASLV